MNCMPRIIDPRPVDIVQWSQEFSQLYNQSQAPQVTDSSSSRPANRMVSPTSGHYRVEYRCSVSTKLELVQSWFHGSGKEFVLLSK